MAGYSDTPLAKKLGFKAGSRIRVSNAPANYDALLVPRPKNVLISRTIRTNIDIWHYFTKSSSQLRIAVPRMQTAIRQDGMIWISWPKKAAKVETDVTEDVIRDIALPLGLVDIKVCAVNATWSGLKLVIRKELRKRR